MLKSPAGFVRDAAKLAKWRSGTKTLHLAFADTPLQGAQKPTPQLGKGGAQTKNDGADLTLPPNQLEIFPVQ